MNEIVPNHRWRVATCLLLAMALFTSSCAGSEPAYGYRVTWFEVVQLTPDESMKIERRQWFTLTKPAGEREAGFGTFLESSIQFPRQESTIPPLDVRPLMPLLIVRDAGSGDLVVVASVNRCTPWLRNGEPDPPYWTFRFKHGQWYRADLPSDIVGRDANLLIDLRAKDRGTLSDAEVGVRKHAQADSPTAPKILRRILAVYPPIKNCGHAIKLNYEMDFRNFKRL